MKLKNIKGAIFDMDGTLLDTMGYWDKLAEKILIKAIGYYDENIRKKFVPLTVSEISKLLKDEYGAELSEKDMIHMRTDFTRDLYDNKATLKHGVKEFLDECMENNVRMILATATDRDYFGTVLKRLDIEKYFDGIVTCAEVGKGKNYPDIYEKAYEIIGTEKKETYVFEDSLVAVETAKKAGFKTVGILDKYSFVTYEEMKEASDVVIYEFDELLKGNW